MCLGLGVTMFYSMAPEIPDLSTMSHLGLISTISSMSVLAGIAGWLSCIFHGRTADLSAFLWLQEMLLSLLERHQELAPLSTYPGMLQGHQLPGSWTAPLTSKYQPEHSLASSPDLSLLDRANRAECLKEARLAANEWYYRRRKQRWRKKQDTNMKAKKEKMTAT